MTLADNYTPLSYDGNFSTTEWSVTWRFEANADLIVILVDSAGVETTLTLDTHYTVTGAGTGTGTVTYPKVTVPATDPMATGETLIIKRDSGLAQTNDVETRGNTFYNDLERSLDKIEMKVQEIDAKTDRAPLVSDSYTGAIPDIDTIINYVSTQAAESKGSFIINTENGDTVLDTGLLKVIAVMGFAGTITKVQLLSQTVGGSMVMDIWKDTYANFPPTVADTIIDTGGGGTKPTLSASQKYQDTTLLKWDKSFNAGDIYFFNIDSASTVTQASLVIFYDKTGE